MQNYLNAFAASIPIFRYFFRQFFNDYTGQYLFDYLLITSPWAKYSCLEDIFKDNLFL